MKKATALFIILCMLMTLTAGEPGDEAQDRGEDQDLLFRGMISFREDVCLHGYNNTADVGRKGQIFIFSRAGRA